MPACPHVLAALLFASLTGCATSTLAPVQPMADFRDRAQQQTIGKVTVFAAALVPEESQRTFGWPLAAAGAQPVWLRVENRGGETLWFAPYAMDPDYFTPAELGYVAELGSAGATRQQMVEGLRRRTFRPHIPPHSALEGFVFTALDRGAKRAPVVLFNDKGNLRFDFVLNVPDLDVDFDSARLGAADPDTGAGALADLDALRAYLEQLPCCAGDAPDRHNGDPLNIAFVGGFDTVLAALVRSGFRETERLTTNSAAAMGWAFVMSEADRNAPISSLFLFDRRQDISMQRARDQLDQRNHLRLWRTPVRFRGAPVWLGQISRDAGVRFSSQHWNLTTHAIAPRVDEERWYLAQAMLLSGSVEKLGFTTGVGKASFKEPRANAEGDIYVSDGLRELFILREQPDQQAPTTPLPWAWPPGADGAEGPMPVPLEDDDRRPTGWTQP